MKKVISILSVIALISTVLFTVFSVCMGFVMMNQLSFEPEHPADVNFLIGFRVTTVIGFAVLDVLIALYLLIGAEKTQSFLLEIVSAAVRFAFLPIVSDFVSNLMIRRVSLSLTGTDVALYNAFNTGIGNVFNAFNMASVLLTFALALSVAVKVLAKPESKEENSLL